MNDQKYTLNVYNTVTGSYEQIEVTEDVYLAYRRDEWNIIASNKRFYKNEIQFSGLIGGEDKAYENFREFISEASDPENLSLQILKIGMLIDALSGLSEDELALIKALFFDGKSGRRYAQETGEHFVSLHRRKEKILLKLRDSIEK
jgi:hypothetical protein